MPKPQVTAFIQARLTSTRLPNKVLERLGSWSVLELMIARLKRSTTLDRIVLLVPDNKENDNLAEYAAQSLDIEFFRGSELDVLERFHQASLKYPADYYVRLTADCPLICPEIVDDIVTMTVEANADYGCNVNPPTFVNGFDTECFKSSALQWAHENLTDVPHREHVTLGMREKGEGLFKFVNLVHSEPTTEWMRLTLDYPADLEAFQQLASHFPDKLLTLTAQEIESAYVQLKLFEINAPSVQERILIRT